MPTSLSRPPPTTSVSKRSVIVANHKTSVSMEDDFWAGLKSIAAKNGQTISEAVMQIDAGRMRCCNLSSAIRLFVLGHYVKIADEQSLTLVR
jgi:predicted DNA-binding ribbon-helix-helix protein